MNKILASVGLVAVGASTLQAQYASELSTQERTKPWAVSASLRGFYDDNFETSPNGRDTFGVEVSPSGSINYATEQTFAGASYIYDMKYYEREQKADNSHQFNARVGHRFSPRYRASLSESFAVGQDPEVINGALNHVPVRVPGNNIRNDAKADFTAQLTELLDGELAYQNVWYNFDQTGPGSLSAILDRFEHRATGDIRWHVKENTTALFGYTFELIDYTSDESIDPDDFVPADGRNARNHKFFVGADQAFSEKLTGSLRVGAQYNDYYNSDDTTVSPYADGALVYRYLPESSFKLGVRQTHNATYVNSALDEESTVVYTSVTHAITPKLVASGLFQFQHSSMNSQEPSIDGSTRNFFIADLNLAYKINPFLLAEAGYAWNNLDSSEELSGSDYHRNRVYIGIRASY